MTTSIETLNAPQPDIRTFLIGSNKARTAIPKPRILVAEDNSQMCLLLSLYLKEAGYDVVKCYNGGELVEHLGSYLLPNSLESYDLIISDIRMPHMSGLEVLEGLHGRDDFPPMILITAFGDATTHARARELGAAAFFDKPFSIQDLVDTVQRIIPIEDV